MARGASCRSQASPPADSSIHHSPEIIVTIHTSHPDQVRVARSSRERVSKLLTHYPDVSDRDRKEILAFMRKGRHLDIGLLTANDSLRPQLDAFMADHKRHFQIDVFDVVRVLAVIGAAVIACWVLWELVRPASL
jgi:hypothetical protein